MTTGNVWWQAADLMSKAIGVTSGLDLPHRDRWPAIVTIFLELANERLDSIRTLLDKDCCDSAVILARSLFELAVNLAYIAKDIENRLPAYLKHGGIPLTNEDIQQLQRELADEQSREVKDIVPGQTWKRLKHMCCDLGVRWLKLYETFYRYVSVPTHAGSFTLGTNYLQLLEPKPPSDDYKTQVLVTALRFHLVVANIAANVFPQQINPKKVEDMISEWGHLGQHIKI